MLFVASKLVPGAGAEEIRPLKMRFAASQPMIPLRLTAVAAEPHLTVTAYIYGATPFEPAGHPLVTAFEGYIDAIGTRQNYPMALARLIDEAGGDGFVREYGGAAPLPAFFDNPCCETSSDDCFIEYDGACQCPNQEFDADDCAAIPGIVEASAEVEALADKHAYLTRLTTRLSPEEMTFDPAFQPAEAGAGSKLLKVTGIHEGLSACEGDVIDAELYATLDAKTACATGADPA